MINHQFSYPVFVVNAGVYSAGHIKDIGSSQISLFDRINRSVVSFPADRQEIFLGAGSTRKFDRIGDMAGFRLPEEGSRFRVKDVISFEVSNPQKVTQSNKVAIGYSGGSCANGIDFQCATNYVFKIVLTGSPVLRYLGKPLEKVISYNTGCCPEVDCETCPETSVEPEKHVNAIIKLINEEVELMQLGVKARAILSTYAAPTPNKTKYCLEVCDDGDTPALQAIQANVGNKGVVTRTSRNDCKSQYTYCGDAAAGDFTPTLSVKLAVCGACDSGYVLTPALRVFTVVRPLAGTEDLTTSGARQTYANLIGTAYETGEEVFTFNGATAVDPTTNQITLPAHGLGANTPVLYSNGGGTSIVGLTTATTYYVKTVVDANNITLSATAGGTVIDITADGVGAAHTLTAQNSATFLSSNGATASVQLKVSQNITLTALLADTVVEGAPLEAVCTPTAASPIAWTSCGTAYKTSRTLSITLQRTDCSAGDRLAELIAYYANDPQVVSGSIIKLSSSVSCEDCYEVQQWSVGCMSDECLATDSPVFDEFGGFDGQIWTVKVVDPAVVTGKKVGFSIQATIPETVFSNCSFDIWDHYEDEPVHIEVGWELNYPDTCKISNLPVIKDIAQPKFRRQSGEWLIRELIKWQAYHWAVGYDDNPRLREALGIEVLSQVDRNAFYKVYYLRYREAREGINSFAENPRVFEPIIAFKDTDPRATAFETMIGSAIASQGIVLKKREGVNF